MEKEDWLKVVKWMGYVYIPIALLVIFIFAVIEWNAHMIETSKQELERSVTASSSYMLLQN